jgi:ferredoxin-thioredoxin reductase catalytic chain
MADERLRKRIEKLKSDAASGGYTINPDEEFVEGLAEGMLANKDRYGIESCPCRLLTGAPEDNRDIICPCDYRDEDLAQYGACFCALYVTGEENKQKQIPDRRPPAAERAKKPQSGGILPSSLPYPVWRCSVCGYLCAANNPPRVCPICKAQERFERFI